MFSAKLQKDTRDREGKKPEKNGTTGSLSIVHMNSINKIKDNEARNSNTKVKTRKI